MIIEYQTKYQKYGCYINICIYIELYIKLIYKHFEIEKSPHHGWTLREFNHETWINQMRIQHDLILRHGGSKPRTLQNNDSGVEYDTSISFFCRSIIPGTNNQTMNLKSTTHLHVNLLTASTCICVMFNWAVVQILWTPFTDAWLRTKFPAHGWW